MSSVSGRGGSSGGRVYGSSPPSDDPAAATAMRRTIEAELAARTRRISSRSSNVGSDIGAGGGSGSRSTAGDRVFSSGPGSPAGSHPVHRRIRSKPKRGTVAAMNPTPAIALSDQARVVEAAAHMAAKRVDAVLIVNSDGHLSGIVTDKDLAFRVVAEGLDPRTTLVSDIMTHNPVSVITTGSAADALNKMVAGHFRHLPVIDEAEDEADPDSGGVVAVLDITKCLYDAIEKLDRIYEATQGVANVGGTQGGGQQRSASLSSKGKFATLLHEQLSFPDLSGLLESQTSTPPVVAVHDSVYEAAKRMKAGRETAALVFASEGEDGLGDLAGIFTSKDLVLRVLAAGLDPMNTPVVRVMTPHPDCVAPETPVIEALRKMHAGRYLHLPVVARTGVVEGLVDVLKLTYTTLGQLTSLQSDNGEGPLWNKFWDATAAPDLNDGDARSDVSSEVSEQNPSPMTNRRKSGARSNVSNLRHHSDNHMRQVTSPSPSYEDGSAPDDSTVLPEDSASRVAADTSPTTPNRRNTSHHQRALSPPPSHIHSQNQSALRSQPPVSSLEPFTFKLRDLDTSKIHRLICPPHLPTLSHTVLTKLGPNHPRFPSTTTSVKNLSISYIDDEGDTVHLGNDDDLREAIAMARTLGWNRLMLCLDAQVVAAGVGRFLGGGGGSVLIGGGYAPSHGYAPSEAGSFDGRLTTTGSVYRDDGGATSSAGAGNSKKEGGDTEKDGTDLEGLVAPIVVGTGVALVCAFLLGRAFR